MWRDSSACKDTGYGRAQLQALTFSDGITTLLLKVDIQTESLALLPTAHLLEWHFAHQRGDMPGFIRSRCLLTMGLESSLLKTATDTSFFNRLFLEWEHLLAASAKGLNQLLLVSCKKISFATVTEGLG